ncbi:MAG: hypothetical protein ABI885_30680, partial [Gammaproteobacteria bacterium]
QIGGSAPRLRGAPRLRAAVWEDLRLWTFASDPARFVGETNVLFVGMWALAGEVEAKIAAGQLKEALNLQTEVIRLPSVLAPASLRILNNTIRFNIESGEFSDAEHALVELRRVTSEPLDAGMDARVARLRKQFQNRVRDQAILELAMAQGATSTARDALNRLSTREQTDGVRDGELLMFEAEVMFAEGRVNDSAEAALRALEILRVRSADPTQERLRNLLGRARLAQNRPTDAIAEFESALLLADVLYDPEQSPRTALNLVGLAESRLRLADRPGAQEAMHRAETILSRHKQIGPQYSGPLAALKARLIGG